MQTKYILLSMALLLCACSAESAHDITDTGEAAPIYPDYAGVTVPATIAPLDFNVEADGIRGVDATLACGDREINVTGKSLVRIPADEWRDLTACAVGDSIIVTVRAKVDGRWLGYRPFTIYVSPDSIDHSIVYRLIAPGYEAYNRMGIYQRSLSDFDEKPVIENTEVESGCVNCHSFNRTDPSYMSMHIRGDHGGTLIRTPEGTEVYDTRTPVTDGACVYPAWHPGGRYIAFSNNATRQLVHCALDKNVEVFDLSSDLAVYDTQSRELILPASLRRDSVWETFPAFSPDGRWLYYCAAKAVPMPDSIRQVRYDILRVPFDPADGSVGLEPDTVVHATARGKSALMPRVSPDGRFVVYTLADYGTFPIWHHEADLWMLDTASGLSRPLSEANSTDTDSYHSWSSNGRWLLFSSRRDDGRYTRPYICHVDTDGKVSRPFMLPQENPREYYTSLFFSYNVPEFASAPLNPGKEDFADMILSTERSTMTPRQLP